MDVLIEIFRTKYFEMFEPSRAIFKYSKRFNSSLTRISLANILLITKRT